MQHCIGTGNPVLVRTWIYRSISKRPPSGEIISQWRKISIQTESVQQRSLSGRPRTNAEKINRAIEILLESL